MHNPIIAANYTYSSVLGVYGANYTYSTLLISACPSFPIHLDINVVLVNFGTSWKDEVALNPTFRIPVAYTVSRQSKSFLYLLFS